MSDVQEPSSTPDADHPLVGQVVGERYRVEALLGEGGMGAVFRARHLSLDRPVAIKVLHSRLCEDEQVQQRFEREALAISKLDHPNCVRVMDFGTTPEGMKYLVMPLLDGQELRELTGVALPTAEVVDLCAQILRALEHAHRRGLVHRDLKPENVFLVRDDDDHRVAKLVDFGIVKLLESEGLAKLTRAGMAFGTPTYMSPEQAAGGKIDERTDLYSLGVMLYELLTGVPPFTADEPAMLMRMHILADPPPLPETVPRPLAEVVSKLLGKEAHERYATARDARRALVAAGAGEAASSEPALSSTSEASDSSETNEASGMMLPPLVVPVRSGGTVMASASTSPVSPTSSMSHGMAPVSAGFVPVAAPFGAVRSGSHPMAPTPRRDAGRRGGLVLLFVALSFAVWVVLAWAWMRDEPADAASAKPTKPVEPVEPAKSVKPKPTPTRAGEGPAAVAEPAEAKKRREEQKRMAQKWREEQARAAKKRR